MWSDKAQDRIGVTGIPLAAVQSSDWQTEDIYSSADRYFESLLLGIECAKSSIDMAVYIFSLDAIGQRVADSLTNAAKRGVSIRLLIDGFGSASDCEMLAEQLSRADAEVRIYHPLPWNWGNYRWSLRLGDRFDKLRYFIASVNRRDHRKFCIIDKTVAWCGSFNISQVHLDKKSRWRDYGVRLTGEPIRNLSDSFDNVWLGRHNQKIASRVLHIFSSNASLRVRRLNNRLLVRRIRNARRRVWICSAYFAPSGAVIRAIKSATKRNVDLRIIVAGSSDVALFPYLSATYYSDLLKIGVAIYSYQTGILHAKAMLIDTKCLIGSTNLNHRSFLHDLELDVVLSSEASIEEIKSLLEQDMENSLILTLDNVSKWRRFILFGWLLRIIRYWM